MKIALDFDNTFTADPEFWVQFVGAARSRGHSVTIVTSRHHTCPVTLGGIDIVYCAFTAKRKHFQADVWIDDSPKHIEHDHVFDPVTGQLLG
jgi:hypothetical protein